jgi:hypothetical protein
MLQEARTVGPQADNEPAAFLTSQGLTALLALAGSRRLGVDALGARMKLTGRGFSSLLSWLQREYLVDVVSSLEGEEVRETVKLTDRGERVLVALLERTCELPELR